MTEMKPAKRQTDTSLSADEPDDQSVLDAMLRVARRRGQSCVSGESWVDVAWYMGEMARLNKAGQTRGHKQGTVKINAA